MTRIKITEIQIGQELQQDAISSKGRLLLTTGTILGNNHLEILRTWGVVEVDITGDDANNEEVNEDFYSLPNAVKQQIEDALKIQFCHNNLTHPFIKELILYQQTCKVRDYLLNQKSS